MSQTLSKNRFSFKVAAVAALALASAQAAFVSKSQAEQPPATVGPAEPEAADALFKEAQTQIQNHQFSDAVRSLERFSARYPSHRSNLEARLLLGQSYIETDRAVDSVKPLQEYIARVSKSSERISGRLSLIEAYQALSKPHEMMIATQEILAIKTLDPIVRARTLIYQGQAQFALKKEMQAKRCLDQAQALLKSSESDSSESRAIHANLESLRLKLQIEQCNSISNPKKANESETIGIVTRAGQCLLQSLLTFNSLLQWDERSLSAKASESIYDSYSKLKRFSIDIGKASPVLIEKYDRYIDESLEMIAHWKTTSLPLKERALSQMQDRIRQLRTK